MTKFLPRWDTHDVECLTPFADLQFIALDIDGTLLDARTNQINKDVFRRQQLSLRKGLFPVNITLATGRTLAGILPFMSAWSPTQNVPLILYNGSVILRNGTFELLYKSSIDSSVLIDVIKLGRKFGATTLAYFFSDSENYEFERLDYPEYVLGWSDRNRPRTEFNGMEILYRDGQIFKNIENPVAILMTAIADENDSSSLARELASIREITVTSSGGSYVEIRPLNSDKGVALARAADILGLPRHKVLALGDNDNDAEMLSWAGVGVAVSTASPLAMASADYVCRHGVYEGAVELLRLIKSSRRYFCTETSRK